MKPARSASRPGETLALRSRVLESGLIGLLDPLVTLLQAHQETQNAEREAARPTLA